MIEWAFEIGSTPLRLSTKTTIYGGNTYAAAVDPSSFSGVTVRWDISGSGLIAPSDVYFEVTGAYTANQFQDETVIIRQLIDGVQNKAWKFKITSALVAYGAIQCSGEDMLRDVLEGEWPPTASPKEIWPASDEDPADGYCVPLILGQAYIPIRSVNTGVARHYILGETTSIGGVSFAPYVITKVKAPRRWRSQEEWLASEYTMTQTAALGYELVQPILDDTDGDGTADDVGLWPDGSGWMDMLCQFSGVTSVITNPARWIEFVVSYMGGGFINGTSTGASETTFATDGVTFNGGWWKKAPREKVLSNLLAQADSFLVHEAEIYQYRFSKTSTETITNAQNLTYRPSKVSKNQFDSGRVHWPESITEPQDVLNGQTIVPIDASTDHPTSEVLECWFLAGQSQNAQKAGTLYFQKKLGQVMRGRFSIPISELTTKATISPGKVITINNTLYGGSNAVIITDIQHTREGDAQIGFVKLSTMGDWGDITPAAVPVTSDAAEGFTDAPENTAWNFSGAFSSTDHQTVAWAAGTLQTTNHTYAISAGNTGIMAAPTYVYFDPAVSETVLQTTTDLKTTVKADCILLTVAQNHGIAGDEATYQVFGGSGGAKWTGDNIAVHSIKADNVDTDNLFAQQITLKTGGAIQSDNFNPGVDGWGIDYQGDAEFNSATIRGSNVIDSFVDGYVNNNSLQLELMKVNFQSISWAQFAVFDAFQDETKRETPDPSVHDAIVFQGALIQGDTTPDREFGFVSVEYADITTIETGTSTSVGIGTLADTNKAWYTDEVRGLTLVDSASSEFSVLSNTSTVMTLDGDPAAGAYTLKDDLPDNAVLFCSFSDSTTSGGDGFVKIEASFDGGANYTTFLDTENTINRLGGTVNILSVTGKDFIIRITLKNNVAGAGPEVYNFLLCTDPSPWRY